ncbi:hypothetical protein DFJ73DRAFT_828900 [Zopfochytrium polystomum]|nr:hypothetical protein DFJ73DRAFT_828900 [Zopfochytrium polystomum]
MPSSITSLPPIIAFGSRVSQSTPPLDKPRQKCGSPSAAADELIAASKASHSELSRGRSSSLKVEQAVSLPAESSELPQTGRAKASVRRSRRLSNRKELGKEVVAPGAQGVVQHYDPVRYASSNQTPHLEAVENTATQPHDGSSVTCQGGDTPSELLHMDAKSPTAPTPEDHLERETSEYLRSRSVEGSGVVSQLMIALDRIITSVDDDTQMADRASPSSRPSRVSWGDKFQIPIQSAGFPIGDHTLDREIPPPEPHPPIKPPSLAERVLAKSRLSSPGWKTRLPSTPTSESVSQAVSREMEGPASTFDFERQTAALEENLHHGRVDMLTNETPLSGSQANDEGLTPISLQIESTLPSKCSPSPSVSGAADAPENGSNNITELVDDSGLLEKLAIADAGATLQQLAKVAMAAEGDVFAVLDEEGDDDTLELIFDEEADSYLDPKTGKYYLIDEED